MTGFPTSTHIVELIVSVSFSVGLQCFDNQLRLYCLPYKAVWGDTLDGTNHEQ